MTRQRFDQVPAQSRPMAATVRRIAETVLTLGLNLLLERLGLDPRWRWAVLVLVVLNEVRGVLVVVGIVNHWLP